MTYCLLCVSFVKMHNALLSLNRWLALSIFMVFECCLKHLWPVYLLMIDLKTLKVSYSSSPNLMPLGLLEILQRQQLFYLQL